MASNAKIRQARGVFTGKIGSSKLIPGDLVDIDAPYTQGDQYYLSETAGAIITKEPLERIEGW